MKNQIKKPKNTLTQITKGVIIRFAGSQVRSEMQKL